jgi:signal transduction histidine kinase/CheY-like chemotaxis protein
VGRQRGWGTAILTQQQASREAAEAYTLYAGATARRLELLRSDPATLARLDRLHGGLGRPVAEALNEAEGFLRRSMLALRVPQGEDSAGARHFADGTAVIDHLAAVNETPVAVQRASNARELAAAAWARAAAWLALLLVLSLLFVLYREFSRSTVRRLRALGLATRQLVHSDFDQPIRVEGGDEIAELGQSLEGARLLLREAVAERARGLAAQQADRAKTDFLARWSHDLRTPLNAVLGFADLIEGRPGARLSDVQRGDLRRIRQAGQHLLRLVNDVLDITRIEASQVELKLAPQPVHDAVAEALALLEPQAEAAAVVLRLHPGTVSVADRVLADRTRLLQILGNMMGNAIKFNRPGGRVDVSLRGDGQYLVVAVADTGPGIAADAQARLFVPFERLNAAEWQIEGSGLGLAVSQRLAGAMGGQIEVQSTPGQGSCFSLRLPRATGPVLAAPVSAAAVRALPQGRLAYVEDDPVNALLVREMLAGTPGLLLAVFTTAAEALDAARAGECFDLWMIDKQLPDIDGVTLLGELNAMARAQGQPALYAVMLSADALPGSVAPALAAGFADYWTKPVALHALRADVARHLAWARGGPGARRPPGLATMSGSAQAPPPPP